ncbi:hypothetical protein [Ulvibacter antarcticus]|uniref:Putative flap endonuclease-1-like 5' DNA nuclease n=1 Tax=Ulvibacter antarcticus TaxID=442714 RepID=A0A3L9YW48_9FLAO|nr:hypothetical protein [Ulvibacter antarcticus]RMA58692.1 putative flap endonuclease-1-like 5' DNA nuclease [Ulvibacter antarcticus]
MATKTKKATKKVQKSTNVVKKINSELVNASMSAIDTTVKNGEKWQKLASKLIKKSENVREAQINMVFDTAEALKGQLVTGTKRMKDLVEFDAQVEKVQDFAFNNPVTKKAMKIAGEISKNPVVKKVEKTSTDLKTKGMAKFNDVKGEVMETASKLKTKGEAKINEVKGDVLEQAARIINKGEVVVKEAKATVKEAKADTKKTATKTKAKTATKVKAAKKSTKTTTAKAKTVKAKTAPKAKSTAKKAVKATPAKKAVKVAVKKVDKVVAPKVVKKAEKVAAPKVAKKEVKEVKAEVKTTTVKVSVKDDLKTINGIGPKTEVVFNNNGVKTFTELAKVTEKKMDQIVTAGASNITIEDVQDWKKQAVVVAAKK